jgi:DNA N-6-adenine-methyltransferase (Dam)
VTADRLKESIDRLLTSLTPSESSRLVALEAVVERGMETFIEVGSALMEICDSRLYRETHETFESYCRERWGKGRRWAYQMIDAAAVCAIAHRANLPAPANESQARALAPLLDDEVIFVEVYRELRERYGERLTAARIRTAVDERMHYDQTVRSLMSSASDEWYTPANCIEAARQVLGGIDLDPASSAEANKTVKAARYFTRDDDGLTKAWSGRVWMNPPYGAQCAAFILKLLAEHDAGHITSAITLLNGRSFDTHWFRPLWDYPICFTDHRLSLRNPHRASERPTVGSIFVYLGRGFDTFREVFSDLGTIVKDPSNRAWEKRWSVRP